MAAGLSRTSAHGDRNWKRALRGVGRLHAWRERVRDEHFVRKPRRRRTLGVTSASQPERSKLRERAPQSHVGLSTVNTDARGELGKHGELEPGKLDVGKAWDSPRARRPGPGRTSAVAMGAAREKGRIFPESGQIASHARCEFCGKKWVRAAPRGSHSRFRRRTGQAIAPDGFSAAHSRLRGVRRGG